jgi:hypothetical protein
VVTLRKASSSVLGLYFSGTLQENKRFLLYGAIETIPQIRGGMPSLWPITQDRGATKNIAANGSGLGEACGRS